MQKKAIKKILEYQDKYHYCECFHNNIGISRTRPNNFNLADIDTYQILFQVNVNKATQLVLILNNNELEYTAVDRTTGTSQIIGMAIITTTSINSIKTIRNLKDNAVAHTITPNVGGTEQYQLI